jgi:hypothetical protein
VQNIPRWQVRGPIHGDCGYGECDCGSVDVGKNVAWFREKIVNTLYLLQNANLFIPTLTPHTFMSPPLPLILLCPHPYPSYFYVLTTTPHTFMSPPQPLILLCPHPNPPYFHVPTPTPHSFMSPPQPLILFWWQLNTVVLMVTFLIISSLFFILVNSFSSWIFKFKRHQQSRTKNKVHGIIWILWKGCLCQWKWAYNLEIDCNNYILNFLQLKKDVCAKVQVQTGNGHITVNQGMDILQSTREWTY